MVAQPLLYGFARLYQSYCSAAFEIGVFYDNVEAERFLLGA